MTHPISRRARAAAAACAGLLALGLTACSGEDEPDDAQPTSEPIPSDFLGDEQPDGEDGLPADFPRDTLPIVEGEITGVVLGPDPDDPEYTVTVINTQEPREAFDDAVSRLVEAGWEIIGEPDTGETPVGQLLRMGEDDVVVTYVPSRGESGIVYTVDLA